MRIEKNGRSISSFDDWQNLAGPKADYQWVAGRSAFELARAWIDSGTPAMPPALRTVFDSRPDTTGMVVEVAFPEHPIAFDGRRGEPRNADLAFVGVAAGRRVAVTVEAKADESFGPTFGTAMCDALERLVKNERSGGLDRIRDLARSLFRERGDAEPSVDVLRYQLATAVAGTLAFAAEHQADVAVLVVHEFVTSKTQPTKLRANAQDLTNFISRLGGPVAETTPHGLAGPFVVPGAPLFPSGSSLLVGKVTTQVEPHAGD